MWFSVFLFERSTFFYTITPLKQLYRKKLQNFVLLCCMGVFRYDIKDCEDIDLSEDGKLLEVFFVNEAGDNVYLDIRIDLVQDELAKLKVKG